MNPNQNPFGIPNNQSSFNAPNEKPKRKPIIFDLNDSEDATMYSAPSPEKPRKFTKHVYLTSLRSFTRKSLMEILEDHEKEPAEKVLRKLQSLEKNHKVKKFSGPGHSSEWASHYYGRVSKTPNASGLFTAQPSEPVKSFTVHTDSNGERQIRSNTYFKTDKKN